MLNKKKFKSFSLLLGQTLYYCNWRDEKKSEKKLQWLNWRGQQHYCRRSNNRNAWCLKLFWRHDKPWINWKLKSVNLKRDRAQLECGKSNICVVQTTSFQRDDFTTHGLRLNFRGKKKITRLIAKGIDDKMCQAVAVFLLSPVQEPPSF